MRSRFNLVTGIDPSINDMAISISEFDTESRVLSPICIAHIHNRPSDERSQRLLQIYIGILYVNNSYANLGLLHNSVFCEGQHLYGRAARTKSVTPLSMAAGVAIGATLAMSTAGSSLQIYDPSEWKGSMPKEVVVNRYRKIAPDMYHKITDDAVEALMISAYGVTPSSIDFSKLNYMELDNGYNKRKTILRKS